ncbi:ImmA/IrrE family metallo-endopeptidase [Secundilactobacillus kimchicus]|uniref:ImmA/IrrE family metallo-endopeptidase n=1 Tax=Secundilactobacillus kimchicus TaxID=528209 RepID=UPI0024A8A74B|nr:ImmA/IrrE family metallo-endopeptidase [Secundilactobacillus kimchicus]
MSNSRIAEISKLVTSSYHTADPFILAEKLNIDVRWCTLGKSPLGKTMYDDKEPIILLNDRIYESPLRYFTMAHELGHVIMQEGLIGYYTLNNYTHSSLENEANEFAVALLGQLYLEENQRFPDNYFDLVHAYGLPAL